LENKVWVAGRGNAQGALGQVLVPWSELKSLCSDERRRPHGIDVHCRD